MKTNYLLFISILVLLIIVSCNTHSEDPLLLEKQSKKRFSKNNR